MTTKINAATAAGGGLISEADASGILELQSGGVTKLTIGPTGPSYPGAVLQVANTITGAMATTATAIPQDDTIPQSGEGGQFMSLAFTPKASTSKLRIDVVCMGSPSGADWITAALFKDSDVNAIAAIVEYLAGANEAFPLVFTHFMDAPGTGTYTFKVRAGSAASTLTFNGASATRRMGGVIASSITITEIAT